MDHRLNGGGLRRERAGGNGRLRAPVLVPGRAPSFSPAVEVTARKSGGIISSVPQLQETQPETRRSWRCSACGVVSRWPSPSPLPRGWTIEEGGPTCLACMRGRARESSGSEDPDDRATLLALVEDELRRGGAYASPKKIAERLGAPVQLVRGVHTRLRNAGEFPTPAARSAHQRETAEAELKRDHRRTDSVIARACETSPKTVARARAALGMARHDDRPADLETLRRLGRATVLEFATASSLSVPAARCRLGNLIRDQLAVRGRGPRRAGRGGAEPYVYAVRGDGR